MTQPTQPKASTVEEILAEFNQYNPDKGGLLYPNRTEQWLKSKLTTLSEQIRDEERKATIAKFVKWMRIENSVSIVHEEQWDKFIEPLTQKD